MYTLFKGSILPIVIEIEDVDVDIESSSVDVKASFYCVKPYEQAKSQYKTLSFEKSDMIIPEGANGNQIVAVVDTSELDLGELMVEVTLEYTDADLNEVIVPIMPSSCNVKIIQSKTETT